MIVMVVVVLMSRAHINMAGVSISLAMVAAVLYAIFYLRLDLRFGVVLGLVLTVTPSGGQWLVP